MDEIRIANKFMGMFPSAIIEDTADVYHCDGKIDKGSHVDVSRFGYVVRWCDGSTDGWNNIIDGKFETTVAQMNEFLHSKGWKVIKELKPKELDEKDILECTHPLDKNKGANLLAIQVMAYMSTRPWITINHDRFNVSEPKIHLGNVNDLPELFRKEYHSNTDILFRNKNGELCAMIPKITRNESRSFLAC